MRRAVLLCLLVAVVGVFHFNVTDTDWDQRWGAATQPAIVYEAPAAAPSGPSFGVRSAWAEPEFNQLSASQTGTILTLAKVYKTVHIKNQGSDEVYIRLFTDADVPAAATTDYYPLPSDAGITFTHDISEGGTGYRFLAYICATGETATVDVLAK